MVGVDAAFRAKVVFRGHGVELVKRQHVCALPDFYIGKVRRYRDRASHPAIGTRASASRMQAIFQTNMEADRAAVT
jgi:hypothetical protein